MSCGAARVGSQEEERENGAGQVYREPLRVCVGGEEPQLSRGAGLRGEWGLSCRWVSMAPTTLLGRSLRVPEVGAEVAGL